MTTSHAKADGQPDRRAAILAAARRLFVANGYAGTSVSRIVGEVGIAQGSFYLHFETKAALLAQLQRGVARDYLEAFQRGTQPPGAPADERLVCGLVAINAGVARHRDLIAVFRAAASAEESQATLLQGRETLSWPLAALIAEGVDQERLVCPDPKLTAHLILSVFDDLLYESMVYEKPGDNGAVLAAGTRFVLAALGVPSDRIEAVITKLLDPPPDAPAGKRRSVRR